MKKARLDAIESQEYYHSFLSGSLAVFKNVHEIKFILKRCLLWGHVNENDL